MKQFLLLALVAMAMGCVYGKPRYESTSAWIDPSRGLVLLEVAHPEVFVGCDTMSGDRACREKRRYSDYRAVVVNVGEGRVSGEAAMATPMSPVLEGYPALAPREFAGRVHVIEEIAGDTVNYMPFAPAPYGWLYWSPSRKRIAIGADRPAFVAANFDELVAMGLHDGVVRLVDIHEGGIRVGVTTLEDPQNVLMQPLAANLPLDGLSVSPSATALGVPVGDGKTLSVLDLQTGQRRDFVFDYAVDAAFVSDDALVVLERKAQEPRMQLLTLEDERIDLVSQPMGLRKRVLLPGTNVVAFEQRLGVVFMNPQGAFAEFPRPQGPVSIDGDRIHLMYDDSAAGDRVLVEFNMASGEEVEMARFDSFSTLLGRSGESLVVYSPNPFLPGTVLYLVDENVTEVHVSTKVEDEFLTVFGPVVVEQK